MTANKPDKNRDPAPSEEDEAMETISFETLSAYQDGELEPEFCRRVERKLDESPPLRDQLEDIKGCDDMLRRWARDVEPSDLARAVAGDDDDVPSMGGEEDPSTSSKTSNNTDGDQGLSKPRKAKNLRQVLIAASVAAALFGAVIILGFELLDQSDEQPGWSQWREEIIADHRKYEAGDEQLGLVSSSADEISQWFDREYSLDINTPKWAPESLVGANRCTLLDRPIAASYLDTENRFISVYAIDIDMVRSPSSISDEFPGDCERYQDVEICRWRDQDWKMVAVASASDESLDAELTKAVAAGH